MILLLLVGFPIALILAWAFDITAQGIRATPDMAAPRTHRRRNIIMLVATGVIVSAIAGFFLLPRISSARKIDKSIAVLPFENLSDEKENAYFADGIQDDVLTNLSKIGDLKVISRTSVMQYRGRTTNLREIGKASGFPTFSKAACADRETGCACNVQLIDAEHRRAHLGERLRSRCDRCVRDPDRSGPKNRQCASGKIVARARNRR